MLSVVIPAYNEEHTIGDSIESLAAALDLAQFDYELLVVNDGSSDGTEKVLMELERTYPALRHVNNEGRHGFGHAVRCGLTHYRGSAVAVVMADGSDSPADLIAYYRSIGEGYQCAFGSRYIAGARVEEYPRLKWMVNRMGNWLAASLFRERYNDFTNPFKCYRREIVDGMQPLVSGQFNLAIEMSLKAVAQGARYSVSPTSWSSRTGGKSTFKVFAQMSLYTQTLIYCFVVTKLAPRLGRSAR